MSRIGSQAAAAPLRLRCNLRTQDPGMWMGWDGDGMGTGSGKAGAVTSTSHVLHAFRRCSDDTHNPN